MSFILDALRKSEHDRQRQVGPALAEVAVAPPQPRTNVWAVAAVVLLIANLLGLGIWLISRATKSEATPPAASTAAPEASAPAQQTTVTATVHAAPPAAAPAAAPPPMLRPALPAPAPESTGANPLAAEVSGGPPELEPYQARGAAAAPEGPPAVMPTRPGKVIYESLPEADPAVLQPPPALPQQERTATSGLPTADDLAAKGGVAQLRLELHVYSTRPAERFVFINSHRYREGDKLAEGPQIEEITRDGVVLNQAGNRFVLTRD